LGGGAEAQFWLQLEQSWLHSSSWGAGAGWEEQLPALGQLAQASGLQLLLVSADINDNSFERTYVFLSLPNLAHLTSKINDGSNLAGDNFTEHGLCRQ
jgi:hypothetical protein